MTEFLEKPLQNGLYRIFNKKWGHALSGTQTKDDYGNYRTSGDAAEGPQSNMGLWRIQHQEDGTYKFYNKGLRGPLFCGDITDSMGDHSILVEQRRTYENDGKERWRVESQTDGTFKLFNSKWAGPLFCGDTIDSGVHQIWVEPQECYENNGKERWVMEPCSTPSTRSRSSSFDVSEASSDEDQGVNGDIFEEDCLPLSSLSHYELGEVLGEGDFGVVRLGTHIQTGERVAVKTVSKSNFVPEETRLQRLMDHRSIVKILDVIEEAEHFHVIMEYMANGSLFDLLLSGERLTEAQARRYFLQVIDAVDGCHRANVAHRDLKAQNILLDEHDNAKLADFGLATKMTPGKLLTGSCGSPNYAAPELWKKGAEYQGTEVDVWACGVVLYALLTSTLAYDAEKLPALVKKIKSANYIVPSDTSEEANDLLAKMFTADPASRISVAEIRDHRWLASAEGVQV